MAKKLTSEEWWRGVLTGVAFQGSVGSNENTTAIAVLGDRQNTAARMSSSAAIGEILISEDAYVPDANLDGLEKRQLTLKGKGNPVTVYVLKAA